MPLYEYECEHGDRREVAYAMGDAPSEIDVFHEEHGDDGDLIAYDACPARRVYSFHFSEDRCRLARNPRTGKDFSDMLGQPYPKDRKERDATYALKGIEPVTKSTAPAQWRQVAEYAKHLNEGGERIKNEADLAPKPDLSSVKSVTQRLRESNVRFGVS